MSFQRLLFLTHMLPVAVAGLAGWYAFTPGGSSVPVYLGFLALCGAIPAAVSGFWLKSALRRLTPDETRFGDQTGLPELDLLAGRLKEFQQRERKRWREAEALLEQLTPIGVETPSEQDRAGGQMLTKSLGRIARSAAADVGRVMSLAEGISRRVCESTTSAREQAAVVERTISSVEDFSRSTDAVCQTAQAADQAAVEAKELAENSRELVRLLAEGMDRVKLNVTAGEKRVLALGERLKEIGAIVETIESISGRTDMLALNAAIESVRAGEDGRGFALVAEEVRKLADHTASASREIAELVDSMQIETKETLTAFEDEQTQVAAETVRVSEAGEALERISHSSHTLVRQIGEISQAALEQLRGTREVVQGLQQVSELVAGTQQRSEEVRESVDELTAAARDLEGRFSPLYRCDQGFASPQHAPGDNRLRSSESLRDDDDSGGSVRAELASVGAES